jgi:hypothetical protein
VVIEGGTLEFRSLRVPQTVNVCRRLLDAAKGSGSAKHGNEEHQGGTCPACPGSARAGQGHTSNCRPGPCCSLLAPAWLVLALGFATSLPIGSQRTFQAGGSFPRTHCGFYKSSGSSSRWHSLQEGRLWIMAG